MRTASSKIKKTAFSAVMLSLVIVLSAAERALPSYALVPWARIGLPNIVIMYCVFFAGGARAIGLNAFKALFVALTRGAFAGALSFMGGLLSVAVIIFLNAVFKEKISISMISVSGALAHNAGQLAGACLFTAGGLSQIVFFLPALIFPALITGFITAAALKAVLPALACAQKKTGRKRPDL